MAETAEEIYDELLKEAVHHLVVEFLDSGIDYLNVVESLEEVQPKGLDEDFIRDAYESANDELDTILQRWLDD